MLNEEYIYLGRDICVAVNKSVMVKIAAPRVQSSFL